jgi:hypothetical protein
MPAVASLVLNIINLLACAHGQANLPPITI